jgi:hypothetical protein
MAWRNVQEMNPFARKLLDTQVDYSGTGNVFSLAISYFRLLSCKLYING